MGRSARLGLRLGSVRNRDDGPRKEKGPSFQGLSEWAVQGSNLRPPACKAGALPAELTALVGAPSGFRTRGPEQGFYGTERRGDSTGARTGMGLGLADREDHGHDHPDQADHEDAVDRPVLTRAEE